MVIAGQGSAAAAFGMAPSTLVGHPAAPSAASLPVSHPIAAVAGATEQLAIATAQAMLPIAGPAPLVLPEQASHQHPASR